ncbi:MAG: type II secretion system F family protein [Christensenellales bacterium]
MKQESTKLDAIRLFILCKELAMFFKEGIPLYDAFLIMEENTENRRLKPLYHQISRSLEEGVALTEALKHTEKFPSYMLRILRIGEESGKLEEVLEALFLYYQRREQMKNSIRSAVLSPCYDWATLLILAVLMIQVLPVFAQVFEQVGAELPALFAAISESGGIVSAVCVALLLFWRWPSSFIWQADVRKRAGLFSQGFTKNRSLPESLPPNPNPAVSPILCPCCYQAE